jgi:excisionase family DNA binding protein
MPEALMSPEQVAEYLGVSLQTVYKWRHLGTGPAGFRLGRHARYRLADVDSWLEGRRDASTS